LPLLSKILDHHRTLSLSQIKNFHSILAALSHLHQRSTILAREALAMALLVFGPPAHERLSANQLAALLLTFREGPDCYTGQSFEGGKFVSSSFTASLTTSMMFNLSGWIANVLLEGRPG